MSAVDLLEELAPIGRNAQTGGYDRLSFSRADSDCRSWFEQCSDALGLDVETDRNGNLWAWWGGSLPGQALVLGSHLDSVPSGGGYDGPLGIASAFSAVAELQRDGLTPARPLAVVAFVEEEGARFGVACAGSRLLTGALSPDRARALRDADGVSLAEAMRGSGLDPASLGRDEDRLARVGEYIELHVEQGHLPSSTGSAGLEVPVGVADRIWPHGRWRVDFVGQQNHAGTTPMLARRDPMIGLASVVLSVRSAAITEGALATVGKIQVAPGAVNAVAREASLWIDARAADEAIVRRVLATVRRETGFAPTEESWTPETAFDLPLALTLARELGDVPVLPSGAGHDAGVLALAGVPSAMILVRNPTGVSHAPEERADDSDCEAGVAALVEVIRSRITLAA